MRTVDTSLYSSEKTTRIKPDEIDLSGLPRIEKAPPDTRTTDVFVSERQDDPHQHPLETERNSERSENRTNFRTENRSPLLPIKRKTKRYSFEFYDDQIMRLKRLQNRVESAGESIALSEMARLALEQYLKDQGE
jgi:hypothetical protein